MINGEKLSWALFLLIVFISVIHALWKIANPQALDMYQWLKLIFLISPVVLILVHAITTLTLKRAVILLTLAMSVGLTMEYIGLTYGTFFGGPYIYKMQPGLFGVPWYVICYWAVFIYTGYALTNSFLYWLIKDKPSRHGRSILLIILCILADGYFVTAIDLFMDPVSVHAGNWIWVEGGQYFGIPVGNFVGWFIVTVTVTSVFRLYEYFNPLRKRNVDQRIYLLPVLGYGLLATMYAVSAIKFDLLLTVVGLVWMMPQVGLNLYAYRKYAIQHSQ